MNNELEQKKQILAKIKDNLSKDDISNFIKERGEYESIRTIEGYSFSPQMEIRAHLDVQDRSVHTNTGKSICIVLPIEFCTNPKRYLDDLNIKNNRTLELIWSKLTNP